MRLIKVIGDVMKLDISDQELYDMLLYLTLECDKLIILKSIFHLEDSFDFKKIKLSKPLSSNYILYCPKISFLEQDNIIRNYIIDIPKEIIIEHMLTISISEKVDYKDINISPGKHSHILIDKKINIIIGQEQIAVLNMILDEHIELDVNILSFKHPFNIIKHIDSIRIYIKKNFFSFIKPYEIQKIVYQNNWKI